MASAGSSVVRMSGRPRPGRRTGPASVIVGTPSTTAWSTALSSSTRSRIGVSGGVPAGTRSGISAAVPADSRVTTISPSSRASPSTPIRSSAPDTSNGTSRRSVSNGTQRVAVAPLERAAPEHERPAVLVLPRVARRRAGRPRPRTVARRRSRARRRAPPPRAASRRGSVRPGPAGPWHAAATSRRRARRRRPGPGTGGSPRRS